MNNLQDAPLMLLVQRLETESAEDLRIYMQARYDARVGNPDWGPKYERGSTFAYRDHKFMEVRTFAGSLVMQVVFDLRQRRFERSVIFRFDPGSQFTFLGADGKEAEAEEAELISSDDL